MNNIDRFIRVIYTEADLVELLNWDYSNLWKFLLPDFAPLDMIGSQFRFDRLFSHGPGGFGTGNTSSEKDLYKQRIIEEYLHCYPKNYNDNEVLLLLNQVIEDVGEEYSLNEEVNSLFIFPYCSHKMLTKRAREFYVKSECLLEWDGILNKIDSNTLFASYCAFYTDHLDVCTSAKHEDSRLKKILSKGYAENHAHLWGSGMFTQINWVIFLYLFAYAKEKVKEPLKKMVQSRWREKTLDQHNRIIFSFCKVPVLRAILSTLILVEQSKGILHLESGDDIILTTGMLNEMLAKLFLTQDDVDLSILLGREEFQRVMDLGSLDLEKVPIFSPHNYFEFEQRFLFQMFSLLKQKKLSSMFAYAFNVYISALTQFELCMLQDNLNMGFKTFSRVQDQKTDFIDVVKFGQKALLDSIFEKYYNSNSARFAEFRIGPQTKKKLYTMLASLEKANNDAFKRSKDKGYLGPKIEYGLILHFSKGEKYSGIEEGFYRKHEEIEKLRRRFLQLRAMYDWAQEDTSLQEKIVAIDAASFEITTRPEVFGAIFRAFAGEVSSRFNSGLTYHVGEDFVSLPNGLRAIDEAIEFLELRPGDRLGHATALGLDVDAYYGIKRGYVTNTLQEHVDDLAWMHGIVSDYSPDEVDLLHYLDREYSKYASFLFEGILYEEVGGTLPEIHLYESAMKLRGDDPESVEFDLLDGRVKLAEDWRSLNRFSFQEKDEHHNTDAARNLYWLYHYNEKLKKRGYESRIIEIDDMFIKAVKLSQSLMRRKVHDKRISIESNPTSNRKISPVNRYIDLHIFKLNQHGLTMPDTMEAISDPDIAITINTDDSGVFQTDLALEYAFIFEAMRREGFDLEEVYSYLDYLRELSLHQSFVCRNLGEGDNDTNLNNDFGRADRLL